MKETKPKIKLVKDKEKRKIPIENVLEVDGIEVVYGKSDIDSDFTGTFSFDFFVKNIDEPKVALETVHKIADVMEDENLWQRFDYDIVYCDGGILVTMYFKELE